MPLLLMICLCCALFYCLFTAAVHLDFVSMATPEGGGGRKRGNAGLRARQSDMRNKLRGQGGLPQGKGRFLADLLLEEDLLSGN